MTEALYLNNAYQKTAIGKVVGRVGTHGIILDQSIFYATSGGQPGDNGWLNCNGKSIEIETTRKGELDAIVLHVKNGDSQDVLPQVGDIVEQRINWANRHAHMRMHTALHLLSVIIPLPVTGGAISAYKGRLDFNMPDAPQDKTILTIQLNEIIKQDFKITASWVNDEELDANPSLVKTMSVQPPRGTGRIRLIRIGSQKEEIDLQPCGGTHVSKTSEIGYVRISKIEKKGKQNRRFNLLFEK